MSYTKRLTALFLPCLLSGFCLLALAAAPAQAEGNWFVNGSKLGGGLEPSIQWETDGGVYGFLLPALNLELVFEGFVFKSGTLTTEGKGTAEFTFTKGKVNSISPLELVPNCTVGDLQFNSPTTLFLHNGKTYNALSVNTVTTYGKGEGCVLAPKNIVAGTIVLEDPEGNFESEATKHLIRVAPAELFPKLKLLFGAQNVVLDGSWVLSLSGIHTGLTWSGIG